MQVREKRERERETERNYLVCPEDSGASELKFSACESLDLILVVRWSAAMCGQERQR